MKTAMDFVKNIEEEEVVCAKFVDQGSLDWVAFIDDVELEKVIEEIQTIESEVNQMKEGMKQFPLAKKIAKATKMRKLQHKVTVLCTQQYERIENVAELEDEVELITGIIHLVHHKVCEAVA